MRYRFFRESFFGFGFGFGFAFGLGLGLVLVLPITAQPTDVATTGIDERNSWCNAFRVSWRM
jgi:hypothetical protein